MNRNIIVMGVNTATVIGEVDYAFAIKDIWVLIVRIVNHLTLKKVDSVIPKVRPVLILI